MSILPNALSARQPMDDHAVALYMRAVPALAPEDSIGRAAELLRHTTSGTVPVVSYGCVVGLIEESELREAFADPNSAVAEHMNTDYIRLPATTPRDRAADALHITDRQAVVVADDDGHYLGIVTAADLLSRERVPTRPPAIGGMATPFGVYLTTGAVTGGRQGWALVGTGLTLFGIYLVADLLTSGLLWLIQRQTAFHAYDWAIGSPTHGLPHAVCVASQVLVMLLFLVLLRSSRLACIHGAEHMVVHAIERGERLEPEVVERMPRVHPRCGSNLAAGAILFLTLASIKLSPDWADVGMLASLVLTVALWRPVGYIVQHLATTRTPNRRQLLQAIDAGEELVARSIRAGNPRAGLLQRLGRSGLPQIMAGVLLVGGVLWFVSVVCHVDLPIVG